MPVLLRCACGRLLRVRDDMVGKRVKCPACGGTLLAQAAPEDEAIQKAPAPARPHRVAAEPPRAHRRVLEDDPSRPPADEARPRPRPRRQQAGGNLALWLVAGGAGLVAVVAVVLFLILGGRGGPPREPGGPGLGGRGGPFPPVAQAELGEGFIKEWLLLAPIPLAENQSAVDALGKEQIPGEAQLRPRAEDKVTVGGQELTWKEYQVKEYFFDFNDFLGAQTENSVGYAVCYVRAPEQMQGILLRIGSDDQAKVYLNGQEILQQDLARPLRKDDDTAEVTLRAGVNVLVFKVINEKRNWSGCARFTDRDGNVLRDLQVTTSPQ